MTKRFLSIIRSWYCSCVCGEHVFHYFEDDKQFSFDHGIAVVFTENTFSIGSMVSMVFNVVSIHSIHSWYNGNQ